VLRGRDGWLFLQRDTNDVIGQHCGSVTLSRGRRRAWGRVLRERRKVAARLGSRWICLVAPDKEAVYAEQLPPGLVPVSRRPVHQLLELAEVVDAPLVYPLDALRSSRSEGDVYPRTDTHWNRRGAFIAYRLLCEHLLGSEVPVAPLGSEAVRWSQAVAPGSLGRKLSPPASSPVVRATLSRHRSRLVFDNRIHTHGRILVFEAESDGGPSCVVFGESMANNVLLFLKESFRRLVFVHTSMFLEEVLDREQPDVVVSLPLERFLISVPEDGRGLVGLTRTIERKLRNGRVRPADEPFLRGIPRSTTDSEVGQLPWMEAQ
jgi:hypothetical protein